jgi:NAD(P)-dependent dehydrogenase (short-subunit alcohol dehydrogenase family)
MNIAFITGTSRGLGEALAADLLAQGWKVAGIGRGEPKRLDSPHYRHLGCDLADAQAIARVVEPAMRESAAARPARAVLINNAASAGPIGRAGELDAAGIAAALAVNLTAPAVLADAFCRAFLGAADEVLVINVSSGSAERALAGSGLYSTAKAGLEMFTRTLALDHERPDFRAISLRPGIIDTEMQLFMRGQPAERLPGVGLFKDFHASGQLVAPDVAARRIVAKLVLAPVEHGKTYRYADL